MTPEAQSLSVLRGELANLGAAYFFVLIGLIAFAIAAIRRRGGVRILVWIGLWSIIFGSNMLAHSPAITASLSPSLNAVRSFWSGAGSYLTIIAAGLAFLELTLGRLRRLLQLLLVADVLVAVAGIGWFLISGHADTFIRFNQLLAVAGLLALLATVSIPNLSRRFLILSNHRALTIGTFIFAAQALWVNVVRPFNIEVPAIYSSLGFAVLLLSFGYVAIDMIRTNERRLLAIDSELQIARQLQFSILPASPPKIANLRIAAAYEPMTAVAGDFYEFVPIDEQRVGFLVADVSGHGVPAALIASMIKVATQSVNGCASDPSEVLRRLGGILNNNLQGQFVSAAYFWIDTSSRQALYSAAGHPPLLRWNKDAGTLNSIESNGMIFGVLPELEYPVCTIPLVSGDRFLLYTDGVTESENGAGEQFGDRKLEHVVRECEALPASDLLFRLLAELRSWRPAALPQQDDVTLIVIDVL
jgi:phosphoserine phosphatase RsbU/P